MDSNGIIWSAAAIIIGLLGLIALIGRGRNLPRVSSVVGRLEPTREAPVPEPIRAEHAEGETAHEERHRLVEAKNSAEKAYTERVNGAERDFGERKDRADVLLRAAEMFLEHAQEYGRGHLGALRDREGTAELWGHEVDVDGETFFVDAAHRASPQIESLEKRRSQRIRSAREHLADVMLEQHLALAAAEKRLAEAKARSDDVLSATAALEAYDARNNDRAR